jgi:hypothetical protein
VDALSHSTPMRQVPLLTLMSATGNRGSEMLGHHAKVALPVRAGVNTSPLSPGAGAHMGAGKGTSFEGFV